jgi:kinesin family protein 15
VVQFDLSLKHYLFPLLFSLLHAYYIMAWSNISQMKDDSKNSLSLENLSEEYVTSYDDVTQILIKGLSSRKVGPTTLNSKSSRSHIIFTLVIESWCKELQQMVSVVQKVAELALLILLVRTGTKLTAQEDNV